MNQPGYPDTIPPGLLERKGFHVMRDCAKIWARTHPEEARELPGWLPSVLEATLGYQARLPDQNA